MWQLGSVGIQLGSVGNNIRETLKISKKELNEDQSILGEDSPWPKVSFGHFSFDNPYY